MELANLALGGPGSITWSKERPRDRHASIRLLCAEEQDGNLDKMADTIRGGPAQDVRNEAVAVRGHGEEIGVLLGGGLDQLRRGIAPGEPRLDLEPLAGQVALE